MPSRPVVVALALMVAVLGIVPSARAAVHEVTASGLTFSPADISIQVGDTVRWLWSDGSHTVTSGTGALDPDSGDLFNSFLNSGTPQFEFTFNAPGVVPYYCGPHEFFNMKGTVTVEQPADPPTAYTVFGSDFVFSPADLTIKVGDQVTWRWVNGVHTVTSGTGIADPDWGDLFNAPLSPLDTTFTFTFDSTGVYPYFCSPHELVGMVGTITVQDQVLGTGDLPRIVSRLQAAPNPFTRSVRVNFTLAEGRAGSVDVFDAAGRRVAGIFTGELREGVNEVVWDGRTGSGEPAAAGIYFVRVRTTAQVASTKIFKSR